MKRVSAALAAAHAQSAMAGTVRFPGEDGGQSLVEMAQRDLDAALQLLADRAQYITGASGAAIALRRDGMNDMLCRASTGANAPELGALLSTEFGLSGESVRTKRPLRCDDAERDARVNHEVCWQLGIASVVVMPVVNDDQVLGVFELFSGKANAFGERDLSAVQRLSEMVETAVRLAHATAALPKQLAKEQTRGNIPGGVQAAQFVGDFVVGPSAERKPEVPSEREAAASAHPVASPVAKPQTQSVEQKPASRDHAEVALPKKPLFWSAPLNAESEVAKPAEIDQSHVPPVLRDRRKCAACGFPVSTGRVLCVECEEKRWRGQLRSQSSRAVAAAAGARPTASATATAPSMAKAPASLGKNLEADIPPASSGETPSSLMRNTISTKPTTEAASAALSPGKPASEMPATDPAPDFLLSAAAEPSQSWLAANKYVVGILLLVAVAVAAILFLR